jgi:asparagine synthase (glutamine-hydrolysing)
MCGICGYVKFRPQGLGPEPANSGALADASSAARGVAAVEAMLGALAHRGPDASGLQVSGPAVLGATRLAIRGIADGRQPLVDPASGVVAVCNGELDNHREIKAWLAARGRPVAQATDVAVIPGLYLELGDDFPAYLVGAFAIALWDPRRRRLLLARDRAGEKPLFFRAARVTAAQPSQASMSPGGAPADDLDVALVATELAALAASHSGPAAAGSRDAAGAPSADLDQAALAHYLRFGCFAVPGTPFAGVQKVGPGERIVLDAGGIHRHRYWRWRQGSSPALPAAGPLSASPALPAPSAPPALLEPLAPAPVSEPPPAGSAAGSGAGASLPASSRVADFDRVFRQAIGRQVDVEVPCGVFLSGGLDSSLVAAVARDVRPDVALAAFSLRFHEDSYDEGEVAARVARRLGLAATEVWVRPEDFMASLPELVRMAGEPLADPAWVPAALLARRAAADVRQVLVGEGGDELFGGYPTHSGVWLAERYARLPRMVRRLAAGAVAKLPPSDKKVTVSFLLKRFIAGDGIEGLARHQLWTSNIAPDILARLGIAAAPSAVPAGLPPGTLLDRVQQYDLETSLAEGLLTKADRASMHFALELRAPFLDRDVMEWAAGLPDEQRVRGLRTKVFLKRYARSYLPRWVIERRKRGLSVPLASWLRGPLRAWAADRLHGGRLAAAGVDEAAAAALFREHLNRERDHARSLWTLIVLAEWLDWVAGLSTDLTAATAANAAAVVPAGDGMLTALAEEPAAAEVAVAHG